MFRAWSSRIIAASNSLTRRHLEWVFRVASTRPLAVICLFAAAVVLAVAMITSIHFETDIFRLFPSRQPALRLLLDSLEWTGSANEAYFLLEGDPPSLPAEAGRFAERLGQARVDGQPAFKRITWRIYDESQAASFKELIAYAVIHPQLFIQPDDLPRFVARFAPDQANAALQQLQANLAGQFGGFASGLATVDPFSLRDLILPRLKTGGQALDLDPASPYFLSRNGAVLIMIAEPARPVQDMVFARKLVAAINDARRGSPISISCAGAHISAVLDEAAMKSNVLVSIVISLLVVLGIFYIAYRRLLPTLLIPLILACGVLFALGTAGLFLRSIHIISFAFTALITGIGTDYSIHIYDRFHSERAAGKTSQEALELAILDTGRGVFTAAITTAVPFLALMVSDVRALYELGLLVGLGVIYSLYATLFFLPPLLLFMERRFPITYRPIPSLGLPRLWRAVLRHPAVVATGSLLMTAGLCWAAFSITFDGELKNLQPRHSEAFLAQEKIERNLSIAPKQILVALEGRDLPDVLERVSRLDALAASLQARGQIVAWSSLCRVINSQKTQMELSLRLREQFGGARLEKSMRGALDRQGFATGQFQPFLNGMSHLQRAVPVSPEEAVARLSASPLKGVVDRHLVKTATGYHALAYLHYSGSTLDLPAFQAALAALDPAARVTGIDLISNQLKDAVRNSFTGAFLLGGVLVLFFLLAHFASMPSGVLYSLFPVAAASGCMLGTMALSGMGLNFMNAMVLVTIVGMGSDFGLYIRFRVTAETSGERERQYVQIGRSVFLSAMTTIVGFGSLALTDYGAMSSIGWATNLGVGFITFFSLVTLPAAMALKGFSRTG
ncbi:MMPL family transporter [Oryzomonas rubra]|uniref:RND transporter n=1 Tax=Oryzomonas rubra TaxID=2509454 RepID=A0A5A9XR84_9BACT|nr:MMPL family transporter [Oryzomonas rubra]KAA0895055.1 RND transporter [Oryzomonas rubra]